MEFGLFPFVVGDILKLLLTAESNRSQEPIGPDVEGLVCGWRPLGVGRTLRVANARDMSNVEAITTTALHLEHVSLLPGPGVEIRVASVCDADTIAELGATTFRDTYAASNTRDDMEAYVAEHFNPSRIRREMRTEGGRFYLAFGAHGVAGYAKTRRQAAPECVDEGYLELQRLYVLSAQKGASIGGSLLRTLIGGAIREGWPGMWLGVDQANASAIAFYRRFGFEIAGHKSFVLGSSVHPDFVMARSLRYASDAPTTASLGAGLNGSGRRSSVPAATETFWS